jgi:phasin family protein
MKRQTAPETVARNTPMTAKTEKTDPTDFAKRAFAPAIRLNEMFVGNVERVAKFQYELAGDLMELALEQMHATVKAKDLTTLMSQQREIATKFAEKSTKRQQAMAKIAADSQAGFATWFEEASAAATSKAS